jgi:diguanylate cyclase (GGDEF)-like protein
VRWGGEEFLLLLRDVEADDVLRIAERLRRDIAAKRFANGRGGVIRLTCSIGFSMHPLAAHGDMATFEMAVELADLALYRAKYLGRDRCVGLLATAPLSPAVLGEPLAPQLEALLTAGQLKWMRPVG